MKKIYKEIDILKGFGIIFMILGHVSIGYPIEKYISSFHMPLFFCVSGFLYVNRNLDFKSFNQKKVKRLLRPYVIFGIFHYIVKVPYLIIKNENILEPLYHLFFFNNDKLPICGALWFLTALYFVYIIYFFIDKINNNILKNISVFFLVMLGYWITLRIRLPLSFDIALISIGFFHIGHLFRNIYENRVNLRYMYIIAMIFGGILSYINQKVNLREAIFGNFIIFYFCSIILTLGWLGVSIKLKNIGGKIVSELEYIGKNSLLYMIFNQIIVWIPNNIINKYKFLGNCYLKIVLVFFTLIILHYISKVFKNNKTLNKIIGA